MALPWILIQYTNGPAPPGNGTAGGPPPWSLIGYGTDVGAVTPPAVGTVGGSRKHHHAPGGRYVRREEWERLLEEIRREHEAKLAPSRAKAAQAAVRQAKQAAAELAEQLLLAEAVADQEALAREIVAAERASKVGDALRLAAAAMDMIADIQARIDEDEDDVMMLGAAL